MAIIKRTELKEEVLPNQVIQVRRATVVEEDGIELGRSYHRHVVCPGDDISGEDPEVQAIANALWTQEVIDDYLESIAKPEELPAE